MNEIKNIDCVWDLKPLKNIKSNTPVRCQMPDGTKRDITCQYYVVDGDCYFFILNKEIEGYDNPSNIRDILVDIDCERQHDCWDGYKNDNLFEGNNSFYDCGLYLAEPTDNDTDFGKIYNVINTKISEEEVLFILIVGETIFHNMTPEMIK